MADKPARSLIVVIQESGLLGRDELEPVWREFLATSPTAAEADSGFAQHLVRTGRLTPWQAKQLLAGKTKGFFLGKYKLLGVLGRGGMGSVFLAEHTGMQRRVALKVLPRELVRNASYLERFQREARVIALLDHPNIVRAYDFDHDRELYFLALEWVEGRDLATMVKSSGPLPVTVAAQYMLQAARGLGHAHERGIIHRDVKPSNLLVDHAGILKVLDLGLARQTHGGDGSVTRVHAETLLGTADYLSPEQALDSHDVDRRTDVYSLGCTMYFALAGHAPFPEGTLAQRIAQHQSSLATPLDRLRPEIPRSLAAIGEKMMSKRPDDRFANMAELERVFTQFLAETRPELPPPLSPSTPPVDTTPPRPADRLVFTESSPPMTSQVADEAVSMLARQQESDVSASLRLRRHRPMPARKPPRWLWFVLAALVIAIAILSYKVASGT